MNYAWDISQSETEKYFERIIIAFIIDVSREKKDKLAHVISMIHQRGRKKRSVVVENGVYSMEIH